jgi:Tfp pilus assembly protein PilP
MRVNRALTLTAIAGALIAWFAAAATSSREVAPPIVLPAPRVDRQGADLAKEITRLHDRLRPDATPRQPARNLFAYHMPTVRREMAPAAPAPTAQAALSEPAAPAAPPLPPLKLDGIAEDDGADGATRTAIISADGQLFLVKVGDTIGSRYRVGRVGAEVVELIDAIDGSVRRLSLK